MGCLQWAKENFGNATWEVAQLHRRRLMEIVDACCSAESASMLPSRWVQTVPLQAHDPTFLFVPEEMLLWERLKKALDHEELVLQQQSRLMWLAVRDSNSAFFHRLLLIRHAQNEIWCLHGDHGVIT